MKKYFRALFTVSMCLTGSLSHAATALDNNTVVGQYLIKAVDVYFVAEVSIQKNSSAQLKVSDGEGGVITCNGSYSFDTQSLELRTSFVKCGDAPQISHAIHLAGQSVESLKNGSRTTIDVDLGNGDPIDGLPVSIKKF